MCSEQLCISSVGFAIIVLSQLARITSSNHSNVSLIFFFSLFIVRVFPFGGSAIYGLLRAVLGGGDYYF
jgi:hypothetical protein